MELWQFISLVVTTISVAIAGTWRVSSLMNAQRIETRDLLAELRKDNQRAHDEIGKRIKAQGERIETQGLRIEACRQELSDRISTQRQELGDKIDTQGQELGDRIGAVRQELGDRIGSLAVQVARLVGREEGRDPP